jgi:outer membrane protein assembly factor BamA
MKNTDIAWAAGLFEGEGCISLPSNHSVSLKLKMTDRDVVERLHALFPCPKIEVKNYATSSNPNYKTQYGWNITDGKEITRILNLFMPYFGQRRKAKAQELLAFIKTRPGRATYNRTKTHCLYGHPYDEGNTYINPKSGSRMCRTCIKGRNARHSRERSEARRLRKLSG